MEKEPTPAGRCADCRRELGLGVDAIALGHGVIGPRGFVPLGKKEFYCDEDCLRRRVQDVDVKHLRRRVP